MNELYERMKNGTPKQRQAYKVIGNLHVLEDFNSYQPVICGTIPIGLDVKDSDIDIIMEVYDCLSFERRLLAYFGDLDGFSMKKKSIRNRPVVKANFHFQGFQFELFGQPQPVGQQNAYVHMLIEEELMRRNPRLREEVLQLRKRGFKTEQAFCELLGIEGDPYRGLTLYGEEMNLKR
ncbi:protein of unknown function [Halobacillus dabanensis]|uniref:DUF4269 domain-containing protein n=1 Tax=Halobacillus dabanensis TaxID=240302 RepID=A0A1I3TIR5_HALDA|nr:DUF4269 domain-containing protein [Halobacillus dabanensis]SFJ69516.1 protein of unknown function [Halobacillus dabanensis]